jgi:hypothetical protein
VVDLPLWQRRLEVDIKPFEIRTFRISRDPDIEIEETDLLERTLAVDGGTTEGVAGITAHSGGSYSPL